MGLDSKKFANDLFMERSKRGYSRAKVASETNVNKSVIRTIEECERGVSAHNFIDLCIWMNKDLN